MIFFGLTLAVVLIALGFGVLFLIWSYRNEGAGVVLAKVFGFIISILAFLLLICTLYHGAMHWSKGYYNLSPPGMMMNKMQQR